MSVLRGDCVEVMGGMDADSIDAIVCDPPYGLEFMGKEWDRLGGAGFHAPKDEGRTFSNDSGHMFDNLKALPRYGSATAAERFHAQWATAALRVSKPGAYLLAFGGTRTVHRMTCALEDAGWVIRDLLMWGYAQGFPKSKASLKPAWEPIVLARKPGPLRDLNIDAARIGDLPERTLTFKSIASGATVNRTGDWHSDEVMTKDYPAGRWPANVILTDPILDGGWGGIVGGGEQSGGGNPRRRLSEPGNGLTMNKGWNPGQVTGLEPFDTAGTYSHFFLIPKAPTRERVLSDGRRSPHPTQKPEALIRHLVTLVTPEGGTVLDPFLGSGTLGVVCDGLGMSWLGIEREQEYAQWAEDRIADRKPEWAVA